MEFKALKCGIIMVRVVGSGELFSWGRWGTLAPGDTMREFAQRKGHIEVRTRPIDNKKGTVLTSN